MSKIETKQITLVSENGLVEKSITLGNDGILTINAQIATSNLSAVELSYLDGVTSNIQTQLGAKAPLASPTFTGTVSGITAEMVGLGNVTNESKTTMFTSPTFTGTSNLFGVKINRADTSLEGAQIDFARSSDNAVAYSIDVHGSGTTPNLRIHNGLISLFNLDQTGNLTATANITAYSDERLKSNIKTISNALEKIQQLRGVEFDKDGKHNIGVIAQEVQKVIPEVILEGEYLSVAYGNMVGLLIEAIKEQQKQIDELKALVGK